MSAGTPGAPPPAGSRGDLDLEVRFRELLEAVPDALVVTRPDGRILFLNGLLEALFGYTARELVGQSVEILVPERFRGVHPAHRVRYAAAPRPRPMGAELDLFARRRDGSEFPVDISLSPLSTPQGLLLVAAVRDMTERRRLEESRREADLLAARRAEEASRLKSEFLANMSHELRTPLNAIIGFTELLHDGKLGPVSAQQEEFLGDVLTAAWRLERQIEDLLDLSRIDAGRAEVHPERVEPGRLAGEVRDALREPARAKGIAVGLEAAPEVGDVVTDARALRRVLHGYLSNALKFTPDGGHVTLRVAAEGADRFRVEVEDDGPGIGPADRPRLFQELGQLDGSRGKRHQGTGLGLAVIRRLVEVQGGQVGVRSEPGRGSVFHAVLPRAPRGGPEPGGRDGR